MIRCGFFNSVDGDRLYNAEDIGEFFGGLISSGVLPGGLRVVASNGMTVNVQEGKAYIDSHWMRNDSVYSLTLDSADSVLNRIDAIIVKLDLTTAVRNMTIEIKKGTLAQSPSAPTMTRTSTVKEYCLATVYVGKGVTTLTQANITDTRAGSSCGWVTGLIDQVDTSDLFAQWQAAYEEYYNDSTSDFDSYKTEERAKFDAWFKTLTDELNVNTYIKKYHKVIEVNELTHTFDLDMDGYIYDDTDVLFINVGGILLTEVYEYMVALPEVDGGAMIELKNPVPAGNLIEVTVLKSVIGQP